MLENQLSRYGSITKSIPNLVPGAKLFLVSDSDDTTVGPLNLGNEFPVDKDGVVRVYTTIQAAVNAASAGRGDVVLVLPNYDHTLGRTDSWTTAATSIIGLGYGGSRPTIRYTTATDEVGVGANNVWISGIRFLAAADSIARALDFDTGFVGGRLSNCLFDFDTATNDFRVMVRFGQSRGVIEDNQFLAEDTAGSGRGVSLRGVFDYTRIKNNYFYGQFDTVGDTSNGAAPIAADTTDTGDTNVSGIVIENNTIISTDTAASAFIRLDTSATIRGIARDNRFISYDSATADTAKIPTGLGVGKGLRFSKNYVTSADSSTERLLGDCAVVAA